MVIYINCERIGTGDDELGHKLMSNFFITLGDFAPKISHITMVNSGVKLACQDSEILKNMKMLEESGIEILSCGTCLDHFKLQKEIKVGRRSNMFSILDALAQAEKVLTP